MRVNNEGESQQLISNTFGVLAGGGGTAPQLAILGGRRNENGAPIQPILKVGGKKRI
jgi:hypothetical protein